jgi:hypothetical protein
LLGESCIFCPRIGVLHSRKVLIFVEDFTDLEHRLA